VFSDDVAKNGVGTSGIGIAADFKINIIPYSNYT
jgi:hypothetical protein